MTCCRAEPTHPGRGMRPIALQPETHLKMSTYFSVIAFPFAGGSSFSYAKIARALPTGVKMVTLDPAGHGRRIGEALATDIDHMAVDLATKVLQEAGGMPYVLFGHSMGAYLALAMLDRLASLGADLPIRLVLSGAAPPDRHQPERISELPTTEFFDRLAAMGGMPVTVLEEPHLVELFEPILRADFEAAERYVDARQRSHAVPVRILRGTEDPLALREGGSWSTCFAQPPEILDFPGGHFFLFDFVAEVAAAICADFDHLDVGANTAQRHVAQK